MLLQVKKLLQVKMLLQVKKLLQVKNLLLEFKETLFTSNGLSKRLMMVTVDRGPDKNPG